MTHGELCVIAEKWLKAQGCPIVAKEIVCCSASGEIPDAIGFKSHLSILIECKTSRSDFFADRKKYFRFEKPEEGMGNYRFYMCKEGIIHLEDLPEKWGLLWVNDNGKVKKLLAPRGNIWGSMNYEHMWHEKSYRNEYSLMYSLLRRKEKRSNK